MIDQDLLDQAVQRFPWRLTRLRRLRRVTGRNIDAELARQVWPTMLEVVSQEYRRMLGHRGASSPL